MVITRKPNKINAVYQLLGYSFKGYYLLFSLVVKNKIKVKDLTP